MNWNLMNGCYIRDISKSLSWPSTHKSNPYNKTSNGNKYHWPFNKVGSLQHLLIKPND